MANTHELLAKQVEAARCKHGWRFHLDDDDEDGLRLVITVAGYDSRIPNKLLPFTVAHYFPVPYATYNKATWQRWIFECCRGVENHELGEWLRFNGDRPFQPLHGPGENPYMVHEFRPMVDALTTQDGSIREPYGED
jgi:hypothetical protein